MPYFIIKNEINYILVNRVFFSDFFSDFVTKS